MNDVMEFLTSKEVIVVYIVVAVACFLCFIIYLIDKNYYKRKQKQNTKELNKLVDNVNEELSKEPKIVESNKELVEEIPTQVLYVEEVEKKEDLAPKTELVEKIEKTNVTETPSALNQALDESITIEPILDEKELIKEETIETAKVEDLILDTMETDVKVEDELQYTEIEPKKEEAQAELKRLTEELQKAQEVSKSISLTSLEEEQEANAIISLDELMKKSKEMHYENSVEKYEEDDENKPISIAELEKLRNNINQSSDIDIEEPSPIEIINDNKEEITIHQEKLVLDEFNNIKLEDSETRTPYNETKKFKSSPVISPVYGIEVKEASNNDMELENTANYEKLDEEIRKTNEFLMTLKELQKNLQ